jgi:hypothetical protein
MTHSGQWGLSGGPERARDDIRPGDRVCTGANVHPNHEIIAVYGEKAWIRDLRTGCDGITSLTRCHKC